MDQPHRASNMQAESLQTTIEMPVQNERGRNLAESNFVDKEAHLLQQ